jgi:hypothetical protein
MGKAAPDATIDSMFDYIDQSDLMCVCNAEPTTYTEATATFKLADVAVTPDTDFTKANGDVSGRKVTVAAKSSVPVDTSGTATHVALVRTTGTTLRYVTTCTSQALTAGNTVNIPAFDIEVLDPT